MISNTFKQIFRHKFITGIILLLVIAGSYFGYQNLTKGKNTVRYATTAVEKGTIIVSVSGSGQVSVSNQADIKPKVSGEIVYVGVKNGQEVKTGTLLAKIDTRDTEKAIRDAETALETAKLELEELLSPADELTLYQAENSLAQAQETKQKAEDNIEKAYEDAFNTITDAFLDLPTIITDVRDVLYSYEIGEVEVSVGKYQWNVSAYQNSFTSENRDKLMPFIESAENNYKIARKNYNQNFENYKNTSRYSEKEGIELLLNETIETTKSIAETVKSETNLLDFVVDDFSNHNRKVYSKITEYQSDLKNYTGNTNSHILSLLSIQRSLQDNREAIVNAERTIKEKELSLAKLKAGADELEIRAKKIAVQQKEDALTTAKQNLADCYIYSPLDGVVAETEVKKGDSVSAGAAIATIITKQKIAETSLNEVDVAKLKIGQKTTLTFDALPDLSISGKVIEVDAAGTVTQGVVSYGVKIAFDTQDDRVRDGMSLTADIITDSKPDILVLPNSSIKSQGNSCFVELVEAPEEMRQQLLANVSGIILPQEPKMQTVETGLSNDLYTEIISGLQEGDIVVTSTITPNTTQTNQNQNTQGFPIPGMSGQMRISR